MTEPPRRGNAAVFTMQNGTACFIYDLTLPHIHELEFDTDEQTLIFVWIDPDSGEECGLPMDAPLSEIIFQSIFKLRFAAIGQMLTGERKVVDLHIVPVNFVGSTYPPKEG